MKLDDITIIRPKQYMQATSAVLDRDRQSLHSYTEISLVHCMNDKGQTPVAQTCGNTSVILLASPQLIRSVPIKRANVYLRVSWLMSSKEACLVKKMLLSDAPIFTAPDQLSTLLSAVCHLSFVCFMSSFMSNAITPKYPHHTVKLLTTQEVTVYFVP